MLDGWLDECSNCWPQQGHCLSDVFRFYINVFAGRSKVSMTNCFLDYLHWHIWMMKGIDEIPSGSVPTETNNTYLLTGISQNIISILPCHWFINFPTRKEECSLRWECQQFQNQIWWDGYLSGFQCPFGVVLPECDGVPYEVSPSDTQCLRNPEPTHTAQFQEHPELRGKFPQKQLILHRGQYSGLSVSAVLQWMFHWTIQCPYDNGFNGYIQWFIKSIEPFNGCI